jgi:hypothetical protein
MVLSISQSILNRFGCSWACFKRHGYGYVLLSTVKYGFAEGSRDRHVTDG